MNLLSAMGHSFRFRIFFALTLVIVIVIPGTGYFCYRQATRVMEKQMAEFALGSADQIAKRIESFLSHHTFNVKLIKSLFEKGLIDMTNDREILRYFNLFQEEHPEFFNINFGDETGRFLMSPAQTPEVHLTFDPRIRPWYQGALTSLGVHWTDVYLFASSRKPGITVSVPIYDAGQKLQAVCGIDIDISSFSKFLNTIKIGNQGVAYLFDKKTGQVIAHPALVRHPWETVHTHLLRTVYQDLSERDKNSGMVEFNDRQYFTAYADYPGNQWVVGVTLPVSDLLVNVFSVRRAMISLVLAGILLASLFSYLIALNIVRPLTRLKLGIERISRGDLAYKVDIRDPDIAVALATAFNRMAASLNKSSLELERTYRELAQTEKLAAVGQMTAGIAHEIKNPLGIIQGSAQVVANPDRPLEMREKAALFIMDEVQRLNHTLTVFLDFAKPPSPKFRPIDFKSIITDTLTGFAARYTDDKYEFPAAMDPGQFMIMADKDQIRQVILNLMINSVQAMPEGGSVSVGLTRKRRHITIGDKSPPPVQEDAVLRIEDQGGGIGRDQMDRIFDPFVSFRDKGIGLGLAVVAQIMKTNNGELSCTSTPGQGTKFTLTFPLKDEENGHVRTPIID